MDDALYATAPPESMASIVFRNPERIRDALMVLKPEATELKGRVAEALGQWDMAANLYASLPDRHPGRCDLLEGARDQLRYRDAPPYLTRAVNAQAVTRKGLAAILAC